MRQLTQERVRQLFSYNKKTGTFRRRITLCGRAMKGQLVGTPDGGKGYLRVTIDGRQYALTHVIWLYVTGKFPKDQIDHHNLKKSDNRWVNLRQANDSQNRCNTLVRKDSETGIKGVTVDKRTGRFRAHIAINGRRIWLGYFGKLLEAKKARNLAEPKYHGEFMRAA